MTRRELLTWAASAAVMQFFPGNGAMPFASAADISSDMPITVTKNDHSTVRGMLVSYDRDKLTLSVKGKLKDPPANVDISWDQINRVSNGLTREQALLRWEAAHPEMLCATCHGEGKVYCSTCHGTGHDPAASADCPICTGAGQIVCKTPKCDKGTAPCPNPGCLKLSDGGWYTKADGKRWKKFPAKNGGYHEWSEFHVGQVIEIADGTPINVGKCPVCGGKTTVSDPACHGTGEMACPRCSKKNDSPPCSNKCVNGLVQCTTCHGSGLA
jgi:hypothetical protein